MLTLLFITILISVWECKGAFTEITVSLLIWFAGTGQSCDNKLFKLESHQPIRNGHKLTFMIN